MKYQTKDIIIKTYIFMCLVASYNISDANAENSRNNSANNVNAQVELDNNQLALSELDMDDDDLSPKVKKGTKYADTGSTKSKKIKSIENDISAAESEIFGSDDFSNDNDSNNVETAGNSTEIMDEPSGFDGSSGESEILDVDVLEQDMGDMVDAGNSSELDMNADDDVPPPFLDDSSEIIEEQLIMAQDGDEEPPVDSINEPAVINDSGEVVEAADPIDKTLEETLNETASDAMASDEAIDKVLAESDEATEVEDNIVPPPPLPLSPAMGIAEEDSDEDELDNMLNNFAADEDEASEDYADEQDKGEDEYKFKSVMELPAFLKKREYSDENKHLKPVIMRKDIVKALINNSALGNVEKIRIFLNSGIDPNIADKNGNTPLLVATKYKKMRAINFLLVKGANPNIANKKGITPLHIAIDNNDYKLVRNLLLRGADIDIPTASGFTPLMSAVNKGNNKIAAFLIKNGAKVNAQNKKGYTALHIAGYNGSPNLVKKLIANKAALDIKTFNGLNPYDVSLARNNTESFEVIKTAVNREREQQYQIALNNLRKPLIAPEDSYENLSGGVRKTWDKSLAEWVEADSNFDSLTTIEKKLWNERRKVLTDVFPGHFKSQDEERSLALAAHMKKWKDLDPPVVVASADSNSSVKGRISNRFKKFYGYNNTHDQVTEERDAELAAISEEWKEKHGVDNIDDVDLSSQIQEFVDFSNDDGLEDNNEEFHREGQLIESISGFEDVVRKYQDSDEKEKEELYTKGEAFLAEIENDLSKEFSLLPEEIRVGFVLKIEKWMSLTQDKNTMFASNDAQSNDDSMENAPDIQPDDKNIVAFNDDDLMLTDLSGEQLAAIKEDGPVEYDDTNIFENDLSEDDIEDVAIADVAEDDTLSDEELAVLVDEARTADVVEDGDENTNPDQVALNDIDSEFIDDELGSNPDKFVENNTNLSEGDLEELIDTDDEGSIDLSALENNGNLSDEEIAAMMADAEATNAENTTDEGYVEDALSNDLDDGTEIADTEIADADIEFDDSTSDEMTDEELTRLVENAEENENNMSDEELASFEYEDEMPEADVANIEDDKDLIIANITSDTITKDSTDTNVEANNDNVDISSVDINTNAENMASDNNSSELGYGIDDDGLEISDLDINIDEFDDGKPVLSAEVQNLEKAASDLLDLIEESDRDPQELAKIKGIAEEQIALIAELKKLRRKLPSKEAKIAVTVATNEQDGTVEIVDLEEVEVSEIYSPVGYGSDLQIIYFGNDEGNVPDMPEINKVITP